MALKTFVKISSVNNLSDARYCAGMAVDLMGFDLNPESKAYVNYQNFVELTGWISGVELVGEFAKENSVDQISEAIKTYELSSIQLSAISQLEELNTNGLSVLFKFNIDQLEDASQVAAIMSQIKNNVDYFLFESEQDIQYKSHIVDEVLKLADAYPVILGFNIDVNSIESLINQSNVKGLALKGGEEIRPGYKDFDELADILEALELDD